MFQFQKRLKTSQAAQTLFVIYLRDSIVLRFEPFKRMYVMYRSIPKPSIPPPPPGQTPGHLTFLKNFGQIPRYVASLFGQMPHPLELQRESNTSPSRQFTHEINEYKQNRLPLETNSAKFSATTIFLFSLSSLLTLNKGILHDITRRS